jgi:histidine kinase
MRRQLIGDVAHELRTPLTAIMGSMEGLIDGVLAPETDTYIQIHHEAERMQRLVADLQELSRVEAGAFTLNRQLVSLSTIMDTLVSRIDRQYEEKGVQLETCLAPDLPVIWVDEDRFGQILINLVGNALQYTPSGGKVLLSAERQDKTILISVKDTGIGISPEDLDLVFTRFYRVEKSRSRSMGGSGIGLTIARHLVEAHGGRLWAESAGIGQGSIFYITIPTTMPEA